MRHIISLSTIPPRFAHIGPNLASLVGQKSRPEAVELYIPRSYRRFPQWGGALPQVPEGVTIVRVDEDLGPATKVLPAAKAYRGQHVELLYCDDDYFYAPDWAARFLAARKAHPEAAVCAAANTVASIGRGWSAAAPLPRAVLAPPHVEQIGFHLHRLLALTRKTDASRPRLGHMSRKLDRSGYADIALGFVGVALRPDFLDDAAYTIPPIIWTVDDVWISGHLSRRGIAIWADKGLNRARPVLGVGVRHGLFFSVIEGVDRQTADLACVDHMRATYGIWGGVAGPDGT